MKINKLSEEERTLLYSGSGELKRGFENNNLGGKSLESLMEKSQEVEKAGEIKILILLAGLFIGGITMFSGALWITDDMNPTSNRLYIGAVMIAGAIMFVFSFVSSLLWVVFMSSERLQPVKYYNNALREYKEALLALSPPGACPVNPATTTRKDLEARIKYLAHRLVEAEKDFTKTRLTTSCGVDQVVLAGKHEQECRGEFDLIIETLENSFGIDYYDRKKILTGKGLYRDSGQKSSEPQ